MCLNSFVHVQARQNRAFGLGHILCQHCRMRLAKHFRNTLPSCSFLPGRQHFLVLANQKRSALFHLENGAVLVGRQTNLPKWKRCSCDSYVVVTWIAFTSNENLDQPLYSSLNYTEPRLAHRLPWSYFLLLFLLLFPLLAISIFGTLESDGKVSYSLRVSACIPEQEELYWNESLRHETCARFISLLCWGCG